MATKIPDEMATRRRRRIVIAAVAGGLVALMAILFVNHVYDPFADEVDDLRVFLPDDLDFVLVCEDLPEFLEGLREREFFRSLDKDKNFQAYLGSPEGQAAGVVHQLGTLLEEIDRIESGVELPIDVSFVGGLSGRQIVIGGYASDVPGPAGIPPAVAVIQPESAWGQVVANVLESETLCGWFVEGQVPLQKIEHRNWGVEMTVVHEGERIVFGLARVESAILVGTDIELLVRIVKQVRAEGIPFAPAERYEDRWAWEGSAPDSSLRVSFSRRHAEREIGLVDNYLRPLWGPDVTAVFEELFPELDEIGSDLVSLEIEREARLRWESDALPRPRPSLMAQAEAIDNGALSRQLGQLIQNVPDELFGYAWVQARPATLLKRVLEDARLLDRDKRALWYEELAATVPRFERAAPAPGIEPDLTADLTGELDRLFLPGASVLLFTKRRSDDAIDSSPGVAVALRIRDAGALDAFIEELDAAVASEGINPFDRQVDGEDVYWRITNQSFLDDPINTQPGFARVGEWFLVTNWFRFIEDLPRVKRGEVVGFDPEAQRELERLVLDLEGEERGLVYLDAKRLYRFMDVAKDGWIEERAEITEQEKGLEIRRLELEATQSKVAPRDRDTWIDRRFQAWKVQQRRERNPDRIRGEIERNLDYFRTAFRDLYGTVGEDGERLRVDVRLTPAGP